jgi:SNF2 family DNA or RNA helicase
MQFIKLKKEPRLDIKHQAYEYQSNAVEQFADLEYAAIFHEQGLGKSKIAIDLSIYWLKKELIDTVWFIVKKSLIQNWINELKFHTYINPKVLTQNKQKNHFIFLSPARVILSNYEVLKTEKEKIRLFLQTRSVAAILDESTKIKNPNSALAGTFFEISPLFKKRVITTGTPVANRPYDIWAQIFFLDHGESLGRNFKKFKRDYDLTKDISFSVEAQKDFEANLQQLFPKISLFSIRETKDSGIIYLPDKIIKKILTNWEPRQYDIYLQILMNLKVIIEKKGVLKEDFSKDILKRLLRLVQVTSNPKTIDDGYKGEPGKFESLIEIINSITRNKEKCIVWTEFIKNADWLNNRLKNYGSAKVHGKMTIDRRNISINNFLKKPEIQILVATYGAAKEGLTLTAANHSIHFDRTFSLDDYLQSQDRIHRITQTKKCFIYNLVMKDSIDEWIDSLLASKEASAKLSMKDIDIDIFKEEIDYNLRLLFEKCIKDL